jgi:hypothetical protein
MQVQASLLNIFPPQKWLVREEKIAERGKTAVVRLYCVAMIEVPNKKNMF